MRTFAIGVLAVSLVAAISGAALAETPVITPQNVGAGSTGGTICFRVDSPKLRLTGPYASFGTGHGFVALQPDTGSQKGRTDMVYGHVPGGTLGGINPFSSSGKTEGQADHPWDYEICYHVSADQYNNAAAFIRGEISSPSDFHLFTKNCTDWLDIIAGKAGIQIPSTTTPESPRVKDPSVFEDNLKKIKVGHTFEGGKVVQFTKPTSGTRIDTCSVRGLTTAAILDPQKVAAGLKSQANVQQLPEIRLSKGQGLKVEFLRVDLSNALVTSTDIRLSYDPASASRFAEHFSTNVPLYRYSRPGTHTLQIVAITPGMVSRYSTEVVVTNSTSETETKTLTITLPSATAHVPARPVVGNTPGAVIGIPLDKNPALQYVVEPNRSNAPRSATITFPPTTGAQAFIVVQVEPNPTPTEGGAQGALIIVEDQSGRRSMFQTKTTAGELVLFSSLAGSALRAIESVRGFDPGGKPIIGSRCEIGDPAHLPGTQPVAHVAPGSPAISEAPTSVQPGDAMTLHIHADDPRVTKFTLDGQPINALGISNNSAVLRLDPNTALGRRQLVMVSGAKRTDVLSIAVVKLNPHPVAPSHPGVTDTVTVDVLGLEPGDQATMSFALEGDAAEIVGGGTSATVPVTNGTAQLHVVGKRAGQILVRFHLNVRDAQFIQG